MAYNPFSIKNISGNAKTLNGKYFSIDEVYEIPQEEEREWGDDTTVISEIENDNFEISRNSTTLSKQTALAYLSNCAKSSLAVDKNGTDQSLSGTDWTVLTAERIIWDIESNYDEDADDILIPYDGVYFLDGQLKITNITGCTAIELAVFKRGDPDDYWFILDKKIIQLETEVQLSAATLFDFYEGERYCIKIKLYGVLPSCSIEGDDDYTAWGYNFTKEIY